MNEASMASFTNSDRLFQMMIDKLSGTISEPDEQELDRLIETDPGIKRIWFNLQDRFNSEDLGNQLARFDEDAYWETTHQNSPLPWRQRKNKSFSIQLKVAALLTGILIGGYLIFLLAGKYRTAPLADSRHATPQKNTIQLQLAGGEVIDLPSSEGKLTAGEVTLQHTSESLSYGGKESATGTLSSLNTLKVPVGKDYKVILSDGTEVWLNCATELRFPFSFSDSKREISISGEAYLKVAKDAKRPFIVHTPNSAVEVLGTSFNVNTYDSGLVRVALVEGSVRVNTPVRQTVVHPGQEAIYQHDRNDIKIQSFDQDKVLSWKDGIHYFDNTSLAEICKVFPRWFGVEIEMDNATIAQKRFTGVLDRNKPVLDFIEALRNTAALDYYKDKNGTIHLK
jgi:hypothetical protein